MVKQQRGLGIPDRPRDLKGQSTVGNANFFDCEYLFSRNCHCASPAG
jgi:hypothetical protein